MPIYSVKFFETPPFKLTFVDSRDGKGNGWKPEPDPNDQQSCKTNSFASALLEIITVQTGIGAPPHTKYKVSDEKF